jgi:spore coat polysaccharide biosynthesis protein SpsF
MTIGLIIQARTGSTRLPNKTLLLVDKKNSVLSSVLSQVKHSALVDKIVVATTNLPSDDRIVDLVNTLKINYFRGDEQDVLDRFYHCAKKFNFSIIVRITSDNPLIDPEIIDKSIKKMYEMKCNFVTNCFPRTFPQGTEVEIFDFTTLEKIWNDATLLEDREHVTKFIYKHPEIFTIYNIQSKKQIPNMRWTVDTLDDLTFVKAIFSKIHKSPILTNDILNLLKTEPELLKLNQKQVEKSVSKMTLYEKPKNN